MAPLVGKHPYFDGCEIPTDKLGDVKTIRRWLETQPTLPKLTDEHIFMFLHSNYHDIASTQSTITNFYSLRTSAPDLFLNQSPLNPDIQAGLDIASLVPVPKTTPEGYKVLIFKLSDPDPDKFVHIQVAKAMILFNDICISEYGIVPGYIMVCDARGYSLSHVTKLNLHVTRLYFRYMQEAKPIRLKGIHVLYSAKIIDVLLTIVRPFMKAELQEMLKIHPGKDLTNFFKYVPQEIMPEDYGGKAESLAVLHEKHRKLMETKYKKWVDEEEEFLIEATKLLNPKKKTAATVSVKPPSNSFKNLAID